MALRERYLFKELPILQTGAKLVLTRIKNDDYRSKAENLLVSAIYGYHSRLCYSCPTLVTNPTPIKTLPNVTNTLTRVSGASGRVPYSVHRVFAQPGFHPPRTKKVLPPCLL